MTEPLAVFGATLRGGAFFLCRYRSLSAGWINRSRFCCGVDERGVRGALAFKAKFAYNEGIAQEKSGNPDLHAPCRSPIPAIRVIRIFIRFPE